MDETVAALAPWLAALLVELQFQRPENGQIDEGLIPGDYIDATPFNLILRGDTARFIDFEWRADTPIPLGWVITRSVLWSLQIPGQESDAIDVITAVRRLCAGMNLEVREDSVGAWLRLEERFQAPIAGTGVTLPIAPGSKRMQTFQNLVLEKGAKVESQKDEIEKQCVRMDAQDREILRLKSALEKIYNSFVYRVAHFPRRIGRRMKSISRRVD